jgi:hypothetical protein
MDELAVAANHARLGESNNDDSRANCHVSKGTLVRNEASMGHEPIKQASSETKSESMVS